MSKVSWVWTLFNDPWVVEKLTVMSKWDAILDDERSCDPTADLEKFFQLGKTYRITVEEINDI